MNAHEHKTGEPGAAGPWRASRSSLCIMWPQPIHANSARQQSRVEHPCEQSCRAVHTNVLHKIAQGRVEMLSSPAPNQAKSINSSEGSEWYPHEGCHTPRGGEYLAAMCIVDAQPSSKVEVLYREALLLNLRA